jgi:hypothetical protein
MRGIFVESFGRTSRTTNDLARTSRLDRFRQIRRKFAAAAVNLFSYVMTIGDDFTDPEIDAVFKQMEALGVKRFCTNQTRVGMGPRMAAAAEKYRISPAFHTHSLANDPNEIGSPPSLHRVLAMSKRFMVNLDIGHYARGGTTHSSTSRRTTIASPTCTFVIKCATARPRMSATAIYTSAKFCGRFATIGGRLRASSNRVEPASIRRSPQPRRTSTTCGASWSRSGHDGRHRYRHRDDRKRSAVYRPANVAVMGGLTLFVFALPH